MQSKLILLLQFIQKHKERIALIGMGAAFVVFIGGGVYLQKSGERERERESLATVAPSRVELKREKRGVDNKGSSAQEGESGQQSAADKGPNGQSYFLKPSPGELLEQLESISNLTDAAINTKYRQMPVLWKVYFFRFQQTEDGRSVLYLDVTEDGFGVQIESEVKVSDYPELLDLVQGEIIWVGGKILSVDRSGTGTIFLGLEQLKKGPEPPFELHPATATAAAQ